MLGIETREDVTNMAESKYKFERLTPTDDVDLAVYEEAIDYVFQNSDISLRFLHISLAHFQSPSEKDQTTLSWEAENPSDIVSTKTLLTV